MDAEKIAAVITSGKLNFQRSFEKPAGSEIAVEGFFKELEWVNLSDASKPTNGTDQNVAVRVVVRETKHLNLIVTVYNDTNLNAAELPEVKCEIW
jgi:hypothetical protein